MAIDRNTFRDALLARLEGSVSVQYATTRYLTSDDLTNQSKQPALVLRVDGYEPFNEEGCDTVWTLHFLVGLYVRNPDRSGSSDDTLNDLVDEVETALEVKVGEAGETQTTLGDICRRAWIDGTIEFEPGELSDQAMATVPIAIEV